MKKYSDRFGIYNKVGGMVCAFSSNAIDWEENRVHGLYYNIETCEWEYGIFPLPSVIYRRDFHQSQEVIEGLKKATKGKIFNTHRFSKLELFETLEEHCKLAKKLPTTAMLKSFEQLKEFVAMHKKAILKPNNLSRGRGICIVEKKGEGYVVSDYRVKQHFDIVLKDDCEFCQFYEDNTEFQDDYLIQKHINLAKVAGCAFDTRIVMQKDSRGRWGLSGMECRVADPKSLITNISRGGYAIEIEKALQIAFNDEKEVKPLVKRIYEYCLGICKCLDGTGEHYMELGLDIGIDVDKNIWLFEANVLPSFKGFKQMDYNTYLKIRYKPLLYALSLTEFAEGKFGLCGF